MTTILGYSVVEHHDDGSTKVINKVSADKMAALLANVGGGQRQSKYNYLNADECPVHGPWKAVAAGVSKNTGKAYDAFWTCDTDRDEPRCQNRPSREWVETHPAGRNDASQAAPPEPSGAPTTSASDFDDLPF